MWKRKVEVISLVSAGGFSPWGTPFLLMGIVRRFCPLRIPILYRHSIKTSCSDYVLFRTIPIGFHTGGAKTTLRRRMEEANIKYLCVIYLGCLAVI